MNILEYENYEEKKTHGKHNFPYITYCCSQNPMLWVQTMNSLKSQAEEAILTELIYS